MRIAKSGSGVEPADLEEKPTDRDPFNSRCKSASHPRSITVRNHRSVEKEEKERESEREREREREREKRERERK